MSRFVLLALFLSVTLSAQEAPPRTASISGKVISQNGQPLRKADVRAIPAGQAANQGTAVQSDAEGNFEIKDLEPGTYQLLGQRGGYVQQLYGARRPTQPGRPIRLVAGQNLQNIELKLTEAAVISGRVLDEDADPISGMSIVLAMRPSGGGQWTPVGTAMANGGLYSMGNLPAGKYAIMASPVAGSAPGATAKDGVEHAYTATYYPRAIDRDSATLLEVTPGLQLANMDITLEKVRVFKVKGKVTGEGNPTAIAATAVGGDLISSLLPKAQAAVKMPDRTFEISLPPGTYRLIGATQVLGGEPWGPIEVTVADRDIEGVEFAKVAPLVLTGKVVVEDWPAGSKLSSMQIRLRPDEMSLSSILSMLSPAKVSDEGEFTVEKLAPAKFTVDIMNVPDNTYVKQMRMGDAAVIARRLDLTSGTPLPVEIVLSGKAATLTGTVRLDEQNTMAFAQVVLVPEPSLRKFESAYVSTTSGVDGRFTMNGITPGKYKLFAWEDIESGAWREAGVLGKVESRGIAITLVEGDRQTALVNGILSPDITAEQREQELRQRNPQGR